MDESPTRRETVNHFLSLRMRTRPPAMSRTSSTRIVSSLARLWRTLRASLPMHVRFERRGVRLHVALVPAPMRNIRVAAAPRTRLPPMHDVHVMAAHDDLQALLDRAPAARRVWPSLALLERVLATGTTDSIHCVDACVLRHAARSLDQLGDESFSPGLVVLRRRVELVLRRKHGDSPTHWARMPRPAAAQPGRDFEYSLTDYVEFERFQFSTNEPAPLQRPAQRRASSGRSTKASQGM